MFKKKIKRQSKYYPVKRIYDKEIFTIDGINGEHYIVYMKGCKEALDMIENAINDYIPNSGNSYG